MTRSSPLLLALLCLIVCGFFPQVAHTASIETLLMPGPLAQAHAELESDCNQCHERFDQGGQDKLCLSCHEAVADDIAASAGLHGKHPNVTGASCKTCHTDHKGRDFPIDGLVAELFDHDHTDFPLWGLHKHAACADCHAAGEPFRQTTQSCADCHAQEDPHRELSTASCDSCHQPDGWRVVEFDHDTQTDFPLNHTHAQISCTACHKAGGFSQTPTECVGCHQLDDPHSGQLGDSCARCHEQKSWSVPRFDHRAETGFALAGVHGDLACANCHLSGMALAEPPKTCAGCHAATDTHQGRNGDQCDSCHNNDAWTVEFDHLAETGFALLDAHASLACESCHVASLHKPLEASCYACHVQNDPHGGELPKCGDCHGQSTWSTQASFHHDLTAFPLLGTHRLTACAQCHSGLQFSKATEAQCVDCHEQENPHGPSIGNQCATCHTPVDWTLWQFDHNQQTEFLLSGAHASLQCAACHSPRAGVDLSSNCNACHRQDDPHHGTFGTSCQRCHTTESFARLQ